MNARKTITIGRVKGSMWYSGTEFPVSNEKLKILENDMFFNTTDYKVYQYIDEEWIEQLELTEIFASYISDEKAVVGESIKFATSEEYDVDSDTEVPTSKAVNDIVASKKYNELINTLSGKITSLEQTVDGNTTSIGDLATKVKNFTDLGTITESPTLKNNTILNKVSSGVYTFSYADEQYLMIASMRSLGSKQTILVNNDGTLKYIYRYRRTSKAWTVSEKELATNDYVDTKIADLINGAPETLDTLFEIANALQDDDNAIGALVTELSKKADKKEIPTKLSDLEIDIEIGSGSTGGSPSSNYVTKKYTLPLGEPSWVRIAKVKDVLKNSSGLFTFNCYGLIEEHREILTTSVFSVSCGLDEEGKIIADVLPITQAPEISGSSASGGAGSGGGSAGGSGEGGTRTGMFGLTSITIEQYEGEMYVCGLVNFPATETYTGLEVEIRIENNLNYNYLDTLELVDLTDVDENEKQIVDGMALKSQTQYKLDISCNLENYINSINNGKSIGFTILSDTETIHKLSYNRDELIIGDNIIETPYDYPNDLIYINRLYFDGTYLKTAYNILDSIQGAFSTNNNNSVKSHLKNISASIKYTPSYITDDHMDVYLNGELVATLGSNYQSSYSFYNLNEENDVLSLEFTGNDEWNFLYDTICEIDLKNTNIEIENCFLQKNNSIIRSYTIDNNDSYGFQLKLFELKEHHKSSSYDLFSVYDRLNDVENKLYKSTSETLNTLMHLESKISNNHYKRIVADVYNYAYSWSYDNIDNNRYYITKFLISLFNDMFAENNYSPYEIKDPFFISSRLSWMGNLFFDGLIYVEELYYTYEYGLHFVCKVLINDSVTLSNNEHTTEYGTVSAIFFDENFNLKDLPASAFIIEDGSDNEYVTKKELSDEISTVSNSINSMINHSRTVTCYAVKESMYPTGDAIQQLFFRAYEKIRRSYAIEGQPDPKVTRLYLSFANSSIIDPDKDMYIYTATTNSDGSISATMINIFDRSGYRATIPGPQTVTPNQINSITYEKVQF